MYQPTISHFFKSSQASSSQEASSKEEIQKEDAGEVGENMNKQELINILDSDSDADSDIDVRIENGDIHKDSCPIDEQKEIGTDSVNGRDQKVKSVSLKLNGFASNGSISRQDNFNERLKSIMKKRSIGSLVSNESEEEADADEKKSKSAKKLKGSSKLTELDQQFKELKLNHMDTILCVRVGYKYKFFAQDAEIVSNILQIRLVPGKKTLDDSDPNDKNYRKFQYCSIPDTRLHVHLQRLVYFNYKVAVVEQTETSALKKNSTNGNTLFAREIKNIFTKVSYGVNESFNKAGDDVLGDLSSVWAISLNETSKLRKVTIVSVHLNSGEVIFDQFTDDKLLNVNLEARIRHLNPTEVISEVELPASIKTIFTRINHDAQFYQSHKEDCPELMAILEHLDLHPDIKRLLSILHSYLSTFENNKVLYFPSNYSSFTSKHSMVLPNDSVVNLEIFENSTTHKTMGSLLWVMDHTRTTFGFRLLRKWISKPLIDIESIQQRQDAVTCIMAEVRNIFFESLNEILSKSIDLERSLNRIAYGSTSRKEVYFFLKQIASFSSLFNSHHVYMKGQLHNENSRIRNGSVLLYNILKELNDFFVTTNLPLLLEMINVDAALDKNVHKNAVEFFNLTKYDSSATLLQKHRDIEDVKMELEEELHNIRKILKRPAMNYKDTKDYLIEVRNTQIKSIPHDWVKINATKTVSRFRTPKTEALINKFRYHNDLLSILAEEEFKNFLNRIIKDYSHIKKCINNLATYDCILSLAATSSNINYIKPCFTDKSQTLKVKNGRNPIIESLDVNYVPNDILMSSNKSKINIITGPNMGGKSSYIRQVALLVIMAQIGCYIPADSAELSICDRIFTRIGSHDDLVKGKSTFQVEMSEVLHILNSATPQSLLLLDEVGRGTGTHDGLSISYAILEYFITLRERCPMVLFITHYSDLCRIDSPLVANYHMSFIEKYREGEKWANVIFLYKLVPGQTHNSYGFNVAKLSNIPTNIINRAFEVAQEKLLSNKHNALIETINTMKNVNQRKITTEDIRRIQFFTKDI